MVIGTVGQRLVCNSKLGTVKFVGEVPPRRGIYYGVDWDDPVDGKHDGTFNGVKYFETRYPTSGSFIKADVAFFGNKFVDAALEHYDYDTEEFKMKYAAELESLKGELGIHTLELIGDLDKIRALQGPLQKLRVVNLSGFYINSPGEYGEIERKCGSIEDLNLSQNLMTSWEQICIIGRQLPRLKFLQMNKTRIKMPDNPELFKDDFPELIELVLCQCSYTWDDILKGAIMWPKLKSLNLAFNPVTTLNMSEYIQHLQVLDLCGCKISDWTEINKLGHFQKLELLNLSRNPITAIDIPPNKGLFPSLITLFIADCNIADWNSINHLNNLSCLKTLKFRRNPLIKSDEPAVYTEKIIGRLANITKLNGQEISAKARSLAEYDYIKSLGAEWYSCQNDDAKREQFLRDNPRYLELIQLHGLPEAVKPLDMSLKADLITITLTLVSEDGVVQKSLTKKFSSSMLIYKLVSIVKRLFQIESARPKLTFISSANSDVQVDLEDDLKKLGSYDITNGDTLIIMA